ncbi:MAG: MarR family winged helix-turn-helix transcriptional regulator [Vagococcus sp.]|uniref:MarR family winged helix-turn-helix transcriptional regulator n=1 Tax=Vagococcus sp. TaxID=1933889 RepID=UPI002FCC9B08
MIHQCEQASLKNNECDQLTPSEFHLVECIGLTKKITSKEIGERLNITKGAVSQQLKRLIERGVVEKELDKEDKRKSYLSLTAIGIKNYEAHQKMKIDFDSILETKLTKDEIIGFTKGIDALNDYLRNQE